MKSRKRALRRHHRNRMIRRAKKILKRMNIKSLFKYPWYKPMEDFAHIYADNMKRCSCYMCRNQRHNDHLKNKDKLTIQERKALADAEDQINNGELNA